MVAVLEENPSALSTSQEFVFITLLCIEGRPQIIPRAVSPRAGPPPTFLPSLECLKWSVLLSAARRSRGAGEDGQGARLLHWAHSRSGRFSAML